jgi:hypothetical protein
LMIASSKRHHGRDDIDRMVNGALLHRLHLLREPGHASQGLGRPRGAGGLPPPVFQRQR